VCGMQAVTAFRRYSGRTLEENRVESEGDLCLVQSVTEVGSVPSVQAMGSIIPTLLMRLADLSGL
jgi:hypothetical protein